MTIGLQGSAFPLVNNELNKQSDNLQWTVSTTCYGLVDIEPALIADKSGAEVVISLFNLPLFYFFFTLDQLFSLTLPAVSWIMSSLSYQVKTSSYTRQSLPSIDYTNWLLLFICLSTLPQPATTVLKHFLQADLFGAHFFFHVANWSANNQWAQFILYDIGRLKTLRCFSKHRI